MRPEKKFLVREVAEQLEKSDYVYLTDFTGITVEESDELRCELSSRGAEFHIVKNSALKIAATGLSISIAEEFLSGPTAIVTGGDPSGAAKVLGSFKKSKAKLSVKAGSLGDRQLTAKEVSSLADLPSLEVLQAQFLSLLGAPATKLVTLFNTPARQFVTILSAKADEAD
ncbi:MAG: 50S ribosomal protein L10 [Opitutae bacterium]|jgi:large subunit ribosomal protein L10|nr:50S ribosomal protein L10 [Opitutae bacterium]